MSDFESSLPLGRTVSYPADYDPGLLRPVPRRLKREEVGLHGVLPFSGFDLWNAYELSWLDRRGKPVVAMAEFRVPCESPNLVESKSLKLYLNSLNQSRFADPAAVAGLLGRDLSRVAGAQVGVRLVESSAFGEVAIGPLPGRCIDDLDIDIDTYTLTPELLAAAADPAQTAAEELHSHLLKSNCLVTRQPDWGSVLIRYAGPRIDPAALLRYLISFRRHDEFHEQCVERIFVDLMRFCRPERLTVHARYTRRGGLDINPFRSNFETTIDNLRLARQ